MSQAQLIDPGLNKLQEFLLAMEPGDELSVARAQAISGLNDTFCEAVLGALMRAGLMIRLKPNAYVRCRIDARSAANEQTAAKEPATARERLSET